MSNAKSKGGLGFRDFYDFNIALLGRNEVVSSCFQHNDRKWNTNLVRECFLEEDAIVVLATTIPQRDIADRVVWTGAKNGVYNAKSGYHYWFNLRYGTGSVPQSVWWKRVWHLKIPQKVKVFIWRFCRNVVPVRKRLSARGLNGVWFWCNKKVWESKAVTPAFAMDTNFKVLSEWEEARKKQVMIRPKGNPELQQVDHKWQCPGPEAFKINVDASVFPNAQFFSVSMIMRNHLGSFVACKVGSFPMVDTVFEAELVGVKESLSWIKGGQYSNAPVQLETDSLLSVKAILENKVNLLEVGEVIEECKLGLQGLPSVSLSFFRKTANRVAHNIARIPCLANSQITFTSSPRCLLEALSYDCS
ncbi:uncharacterized protein LOC141659771 [Apium graveolens]|uniref:uncharacterized protein LOC141659771 n=1 Tax=Apium graveolens TaxID=4045 RepID=UPI003D79F62D